MPGVAEAVARIEAAMEGDSPGFLDSAGAVKELRAAIAQLGVFLTHLESHIEDVLAKRAARAA